MFRNCWQVWSGVERVVALDQMNEMSLGRINRLFHKKHETKICRESKNAVSSSEAALHIKCATWRPLDRISDLRFAKRRPAAVMSLSRLVDYHSKLRLYMLLN